MSENFIKFAPPCIGEEEIDEVADTLRSGWITSGPKTRQFEHEFAESVGAPAALALNSCTAALHTALLASEIGPGDEIIAPTMTFAATVNVIEHVGARPVLVDVLPDTLNVDPDQVADAVTPRTKAIIPVHFAGHPVELDAIDEIAARHGLLVFEDAAHAIPAAYRGQLIGSRPNPAAFSFYATKNLTTGEGGMLTGSREFIERSRQISLHGLSREAWSRYERGGSWRYDVALPGFKYNMSDIQAAIGIWQLRKLERFQSRRQEIVQAYMRGFEGMPAFDLPVCHDHVDHAWHLFVIRLHDQHCAVKRDEFVAQLHDRGIGTSVHFIPIHHHSYYRSKYNYAPADFPVAEQQFRRQISLPLNPSLTLAEADRIVGAVQEIASPAALRRAA